MNPFKKLWVLVQVGQAGWTVFRNPDRLDRVFGIADGLAEAQPEVMLEMADQLRQVPSGASALRERPRVGLLDLRVLEALPEGSFGRAAFSFLSARGLDPANLPQRPAHDDISYLQAHFYETHDLWHVATGFDTDVAGELGLQAFYAAQSLGKLPWALLAIGMLNTLFFGYGDRERRLEAIARGWRMGRQAKPFFGVRWAELMGTSLEQVRRALQVDALPAKGLPAPAAALAA